MLLMVLLALIGLMLITVTYIIWWLRTHHTNNAFREAFTASLSQDAVDSQYSKNGIEKCSILDDGSASSRGLIDTLRIQKYKAGNTDRDDYCFFYTDTDTSKMSIADPIAYSQECNSASFGGNIIQDAFVEQIPDLTLREGLQYDKCVFKVNKDNVTEESLNAFYQKLGNNNTQGAACSGLLLSLKADQNRKKNEIADIERNMSLIRMDTSSVIDQDASYRNKNGIDPMYSLQTMEKDIASCNQELTENRAQLNDKQRTYVTSEDAMNTFTSAADSAFKSALEQSEKARKTRTLLINQMTSLKEQHATITALLKEMDINLEQMKQNHQICQVSVEEESVIADLKTKSVATSKEDLEKVSIQINKYQKQITNLQRDLQQIRETVKVLEAEYNTEGLDLSRCKARLAFFTQEVERWAQFMNEAKSKYDKCVIAKAPVLAQVEDFEKRINALYAEIEDIKKRCRAVEGSYYDANIQTSRSIGDFKMQTAVQQCSTMSDSIQKKQSLEEEIARLKSQISDILNNVPCERIRDVCCKPVRRFGFNDYGKSGNRVITSTGRIDKEREARDKGANYMRFTVQGTNPTPFLKFVLDKRHKGGTSWIETDQNLSGYGKFNEMIMYTLPV